MEATKPLLPLLTEKQAAEYLGVAPQTLAVWRSAHRHDLPYIKVGTSVRYRQDALERWLEQRTVGKGGRR
jgi:excisionase family DNA binding protein